MDKTISSTIEQTAPQATLTSDVGGVSVKPTPESKILRVVEKLLALFLLVLVIWGALMLLLSVQWLQLPENMEMFHKTLELILSDILLLVVALELAIMLVYRKIEYLLDIMLFVIARRMLIGVTETLDIAIGVAALAALFAVRKYLLVCPGCAIVTSARDARNIER
jgi:hypothetical protein